MKKTLFSLLLLFMGTLTASATQDIMFHVPTNGTSLELRVNTNSGTFRSANRNTTSWTPHTPEAEASTGMYTFTTAAVTSTASRQYIHVQLPDEVSYLEVISNQSKITRIVFTKTSEESGSSTVINVQYGVSKLKTFICEGATNLATLTLGTLDNLAELNLSGTKKNTALSAITGTACPALESLNLSNCALTSFPYDGTTLQALDLSSNTGLTSLDVSANTGLDFLRLDGCTSLATLTKPTSLTTLSAQNCALTTVAATEKMQVLDVAGNALESVDYSEAYTLTDFDCSSNKLSFSQLPSSENKPTRTIYAPQTYEYTVTTDMKAASPYPLQSMLYDYAQRTSADYTINLAAQQLDANGTASVNIVFVDGSDAALTKATSASATSGYTVSDGLYGFLDAQSQVRAKYTSEAYPSLTLYSDYFTVPEGTKATLIIVDEDGDELYRVNKVVSEATDLISGAAKKDFTSYGEPSYLAVTKTYTVVATPSEDSPVQWAKSYDDAVWYYWQNLYNSGYLTTTEPKSSMWTTSYKFNESYTETDDYMFAFVGNQYDGFKIYNRGIGDGSTLSDNFGQYTLIGQYTPSFNALGNPDLWELRENTSGGFSIKYKYEDQDVYLANTAGEGGIGYNLGTAYYSEMDPNSNYCGFKLIFAVGNLNNIITWSITNGGNEVYQLKTKHAAGETLSAFPADLSDYSKRYVTLPAFSSVVGAASYEIRGNATLVVPVTWDLPFEVSTESTKHYYKINTRGDAKWLTAHANTSSNTAAQELSTTEPTGWAGLWYFEGDPFNGFKVKSGFLPGTALAPLNGKNTAGNSWPLLTEEEFAWEIDNGADYVSGSFRVKVPGEDVWWSDNSGAGLLRYWSQYTYGDSGDAGTHFKAVLVSTLPDNVVVTWKLVDNAGMATESMQIEEYAKNATVTFPSSLNRDYVTFTDKQDSYGSATENTTYTVHYNWDGSFKFSTADEKHVYNFANANLGTVYPNSSVVGWVGDAEVRITAWSWSGGAGKHDYWVFTENPFDGVKIRSFIDENTGMETTWGYYVRRTTNPTSFIITKNGVVPDNNRWFSLRKNDEVQYLTIWNTGTIYLYKSGTNTSHNESFQVDEIDVNDLITDNYYRVRHQSGDYLTSDGSRFLASSETNLSTSVIFVEEQNDGTFHISHNGEYISGGDGQWYSDIDVTDSENAYNVSLLPQTDSQVITEYGSKAYAFKVGYGISALSETDNHNMCMMWYGSHTGSAAETYYSSAYWYFQPVEITGNTVDGDDFSYSTLYAPFNYTLPSTHEAYAVTLSDDNKDAALTPLSGSVPANTAVLVVGPNDDLSYRLDYNGYALTSSDEAAIAKNDLLGTSVDIDTPAENVEAGNYTYVFGAYEDEDTHVRYPGFYRYIGTTLAADKAYLPVTGLTGEARGFRLIFGDNGKPTAIRFITDEGGSNRNGNNSGNIYDLQGRRVVQPQKGGVYIVNGKRVLF